MTRRSACFLIAAVLVWAAGPAHSDSKADEFCKQAASSAILHQLPESEAGNAVALLDQICALHQGITKAEPDVVNKAIAPWISSDSGLAFLQDVDFKVKAFDNTESEESGLGFSYDYTRSKPLNDYHYGADGSSITGFAWNLKATGNVAFDSSLNPGNFLDTRLSVSGFQHKGGFHQGTTASFNRLNELEDAEADAETGEELRRIRADKGSVIDAIRSQLGDRRYLEFDLNAGLESDQKFHQKQWTYGAQFAFDYKSYRRDAWQTTFNLFDWPFAALRMLTGYDPNQTGFQPLGSSIPTVVVGVDHVDPEDNEARAALTGTDSFDRVRSEVFFRTPIASLAGSTIWFNVDWRYYRELDATQAIEDADVDSFDYRTISLSTGNGVFLSYRKGKLPFDLETQEAYEIGWKFNLTGL